MTNEHSHPAPPPQITPKVKKLIDIELAKKPNLTASTIDSSIHLALVNRDSVNDYLKRRRRKMNENIDSFIDFKKSQNNAIMLNV